MSMIQDLKDAITLHFGDGQVFTVQDFPEFDKKYGRKSLRTSLAELCGGGKFIIVDGKMKIGTSKIPPMNRYKIKNKIIDCDLEFKSGTKTIWHTEPPKNECKERESYRVKYWDGTESNRVWKNKQWKGFGDYSFPMSFIKAWRGVTR